MAKISLTLLMILASASVSQATIHDVLIANFTFQPADITIDPGDSVRWTNQDTSPHTSTSLSGLWDSGTLLTGESFTLAFTEPGDYPYHCNIHPSMLGSVTVTGAGGQWEALDSGVDAILTDVYFANSDTGWVSGETGILRTTDGGDSWDFFATTDDVEAIYFINSLEGWACGNDGLILHTTDAGVSWSPQPSGFADKLRDIRMADASNGWAVGRDGVILNTTDGGASWASQPNPAPDDLRGIATLSSFEVWVCGSDGYIMYTTDSGENWTQVASGTNEELFSIFFYNMPMAWTCGGTGVMLNSSNGGASWEPQTTNTTRDLKDVFFVDPVNGWTVGDLNAFMKTTNVGATWEMDDPGVSADWSAIYFVNPDLGFAVGSEGAIVRYKNQTTDIGTPAGANLPSMFSLGANYPNPFNPGTTIPFSIERRAAVALEVFDLTGRSLGTIFEGNTSAGSHSVYWNAEGVASGVYFYRLSVGNQSQTRRMLYLK